MGFERGMTPQHSLCVLCQYRPPLGCRGWALLGGGPRAPELVWGDGPLTDVIPSRGPRIHGHDHSVLELEGQGGGAMGHLDLNSALRVPAQGLEELGGLGGRKGRERGSEAPAGGSLPGRAEGLLARRYRDSPTTVKGMVHSPLHQEMAGKGRRRADQPAPALSTTAKQEENVTTATRLKSDFNGFSLLGHLTLTKHVYHWYPHFTGRPQI